MNQENDIVGGRIVNLHWIFPLALFMLTAIYPFGPSLWVHTNFHSSVHQIGEVIVYATTGPLVGYWTLMRVGRWLDEKENDKHSVQTEEPQSASKAPVSVDFLDPNHQGN